MNVNELTEREAAAELLVRQLRRSPMVNSAWRDGYIACYTTRDKGHHLGNEAEAFDADVHLVCETEGMALSEDKDHGTIFVNMVVHGLLDEPEEYGLPTHVPRKGGAYLREDMDEELREIARKAGLPV